MDNKIRSKQPLNGGMNNISLEDFIIKVELKLSEIPKKDISDLKDIFTSLKMLKEGKLLDIKPLEKLVIWVFFED